MPRTPHENPDILRELVAVAFSANEYTEEEVWIRVRMARLDPAIRSGWKLHVTATPANVAELLRLVLPLLHDMGHAFKVARSLRVVEDLNDGRYGLTQVGKVITIYPPDEAAADACARRIAGIAGHIDGPDVPTDRCCEALRPVSYRFGSFDYRVRIDRMGRKQRLLDVPGTGDIIDPADGGSEAVPEPALLPRGGQPDHLAFLRGRYVLLHMLQLTAKGGVFLALDRNAPQGPPVLIKTARAGTNSDSFGRDALWALKREHEILDRYRGFPGMPPAGTLLSDGNRTLALVRPWLEGDTLWNLWTAPDATTGPARARMADILVRLVRLVRKINDDEIIVRDLSPANILVRGEEITILDWELAQGKSALEPAYRRGTPGFYNPLRDPDEPSVHAIDDQYGLLALIYMAAWGIHPVLNARGLLDENILLPVYGPAEVWRSAISSLGHPSDHVESALVQFVPVVMQYEPAAIRPSPTFAPAAISALESMCSWETERLTRAGAEVDIDDITVYSGVAGMLTATADLNLSPRYAINPNRTREACICVLALSERVARIPGYYFGRPGVASIVTRLGYRGADNEMVSNGVRALLDCPWSEAPVVPDLCHGLAGYLVALLKTWADIHDDRLLERARETGRVLAAMAVRDEDGAFWPWPEGDFGSLSGARLFGFGHGVAGVCYALLRLHQVAPDSQIHAAARAGLETLERHARPIESEDAVWWPVSTRDEDVWNAWCHGTPGVVKALAAAIEVDGDRRWGVLAERALRGVYCANNAGFCLCHGIASRLDAAVDAAHAGLPLPAAAHRDALTLQALDLDSLETTAQSLERDGRARGLMTGVAGVYVTLLRYAALFRAAN